MSAGLVLVCLEAPIGLGLGFLCACLSQYTAVHAFAYTLTYLDVSGVSTHEWRRMPAGETRTLDICTTYADVCSTSVTYADVCSTSVWRRMPGGQTPR